MWKVVLPTLFARRVHALFRKAALALSGLIPGLLQLLASPFFYTALLWLHDEHGGYYDHVVPPSATAPDDVLAATLVDRHPLIAKLPLSLVQKLQRVDDGLRTFDRLGFRIPAVMVSPFASPGAVSDTAFDHTSVLRLVEDVWNLPSLTRRDSDAVGPLEMLDVGAPPAFAVPPVLSPSATPDAWRAVSFTALAVDRGASRRAGRAQ